MKDSFQREINYIRISITDRCNLRCRYCMPHGIEQISMDEILTYEEILRFARICAECGFTRYKVTGGEPLVRKGAVNFIKQLSQIPGVEEVTLTTNGVLLSDYVEELVSAGLKGVNISLDSLKADRFKEITGFANLDKVLSGLERAVDSGLRTKVNSVLQKGLNEDEWEELILLAKERPLDVRFIELMPIGEGDAFNGVDNSIIKERLKEKYPGLQEDNERHGNGPAVYVRIPGFRGSVGFIGAVHGKFCSSCNRIRLTSDGRLKPCLCYDDNVDIKEILRNVAAGSEEEKSRLSAAIKKAVTGKPRAHCFENYEGITEKKKMAQIGG